MSDTHKTKPLRPAVYRSGLKVFSSACCLFSAATRVCISCRPDTPAAISRSVSLLLGHFLSAPTSKHDIFRNAIVFGEGPVRNYPICPWRGRHFLPRRRLRKARKVWNNKSSAARRKNSGRKSSAWWNMYFAFIVPLLYSEVQRRKGSACFEKIIRDLRKFTGYPKNYFTAAFNYYTECRGALFPS